MVLQELDKQLSVVPFVLDKHLLVALLVLDKQLVVLPKVLFVRLDKKLRSQERLVLVNH